jgi:hypothetical protein
MIFYEKLYCEDGFLNYSGKRSFGEHPRVGPQENNIRRAPPEKVA